MDTERGARLISAQRDTGLARLRPPGRAKQSKYDGAEGSGRRNRGSSAVVDRETAESERPPAFHDILKARAMSLRVPLQLIRPSTYDPKRAGRQKRKTWKLKQRQDDASVAWNFFTALYYKAGGTPWRMVRSSTDFDACYVGFAFFKTADGEGMATSVAQVYNQRGDGVVVRGGPAQRSTEDRQLHLSELVNLCGHPHSWI